MKARMSIDGRKGKTGKHKKGRKGFRGRSCDGKGRGIDTELREQIPEITLCSLRGEAHFLLCGVLINL